MSEITLKDFQDFADSISSGVKRQKPMIFLSLPDLKKIHKNFGKERLKCICDDITIYTSSKGADYLLEVLNGEG